MPRRVHSAYRSSRFTHLLREQAGNVNASRARVVPGAQACREQALEPQSGRLRTTHSLSVLAGNMQAVSASRDHASDGRRAQAHLVSSTSARVVLILNAFIARKLGSIAVVACA
jgi:hypothetical protein